MLVQIMKKIDTCKDIIVSNNTITYIVSVTQPNITQCTVSRTQVLVSQSIIISENDQSRHQHSNIYIINLLHMKSK